MKVFLSWSGTTSRAVAEALRDWLPDVIQEVEPWMSASDIEAGVRWAAELGRELEQTDFGVICLAADNTEAPWILFEAGALSKRFDSSRVLPYLYGVTPTQITGPLSQFQNVMADKDGTRRLVGAIYAALVAPSLNGGRLDKAFDRWWPTLEESLKSIPPIKSSTKEPERKSNDILAEILATVRGIQRTSRDSIPASIKEDARIHNADKNKYYSELFADFIKANPSKGKATTEELDKFARERTISQRREKLDLISKILDEKDEE